MKINDTISIGMLFASLLLVSCAKETVDPEFFGSIEGQVTNSQTDAGIPNVNITTRPGTASISTDANGQYTISDIPTGTYSVQARKDSFITSSIPVAVNEDRVTPGDISLTPNEDSEGSSNGNLAAKVTFIDTITYNSKTGTADSNFVDVEYTVQNISSTNRVGNYEVYFEILTSGNTFNYEVSGDSLATNEKTFGSFTKYIREFEADTVKVSDLYSANS